MQQAAETSPEAYLPIDRRVALATGRDLPEFDSGTVLFADISGFTRLTGELAKEFGDQRGADEITRYLNLIYGALIARVHQYRGSVISFAGDAITCWFGGDDGLHALAAATGMQSALADLVKEHRLPIQIKIVIASGPSRRFVVGDPDIQLLDLLAGSTVSRVTAAEKLARPGDLLVSREVAERHQASFTAGKSLSAAGGDVFIQVTDFSADVPSAPWDEEVALSGDELARWLLDPVFEKIRQGGERFLAELRLTVSLFLKFEGIVYEGDPEAGAKINRFIAWVQASVSLHDGHLLQVIIGDKGDYLFIGFGALAAHEDDASRAITTARLLVQPPESLSFVKNIRIGITLGRMLTGHLGSTHRRTFSMLGAGANLAARLMEMGSSGQVLVNERVAIATQKKFVFDPLGAIRFRGIPEAVPVFELAGTRDESRHIQLYQTPLVGRVPELEEMAAYARKLSRHKKNGIILLQGEGGMGKTRLLSELLRRIHEEDITVLYSYGYAIENSTPYFVIRELFRQLFGTREQGAAEMQEHLTRLVRSIDPSWERLMPLLGGIFSLNISDNELTSQMYGEIRAGNLHMLLTGLFRAVAHGKAFLVVLDDAQWFDAASWALIGELYGVIPHLGLIISHRPFAGDPPGDFVRLTASAACTEINLGNFSQPDIGKLVGQVVGVAELPPEVLKLIYEKTSGQPFFSEELAYALVASGILVVEEGQCRLIGNLQELENVTVPDTIQSAITSRLDRMTLPQQLTLKVSSIIGRLFMLRAVHGIHPAAPELPLLSEQMDAMTRMNLIAMLISGSEPSFSFKQNIIHDVAYGMLSWSQRRELHQNAARWYETTFNGDLQRHYPQLGYHWQQAGEAGKAADYLEKAAYGALAGGAWHDAITFIRQVLELDSLSALGDQRKGVLVIEMGIAHFKTGSLEEATRVLKRGIRLLRHPAPSSGTSLGLNLMGQMVKQFALRMRRRPPRVPAETERNFRLTLSRAYEYLAQSYFHHNKLFYSLDAGLTGLNVAESAGPSSQLARAYASLCITSSTMPIPGLYEVYARLARSVPSENTPLNDQGRLLELIAVAWSGRGRWQEVEELCTRAMGMAGEIGDRFLMMENTCILAACLLAQGKPDESVKLREELYRIGVEDKVPLVQGWALLQRAEIALMNRDYNGMLELLVEASGVEHALGQPDRLWLHGLKAGAYAQLGDPAAALESARKALALARQSLPTSFFVLEGYSGMMTAFTSLSALRPLNRKIRRQTRQALGAFNQYAGSFPIGRPRFLYWKGKLAMAGGHSRRAQKQWKAGLACAQSLDMVFEAELMRERIELPPA